MTDNIQQSESTSWGDMDQYIKGKKKRPSFAESVPRIMNELSNSLAPVQQEYLKRVRKHLSQALPDKMWKRGIAPGSLCDALRSEIRDAVIREAPLSDIRRNIQSLLGSDIARDVKKEEVSKRYEKKRTM